jgi:hypothetical protein
LGVGTPIARASSMAFGTMSIPVLYVVRSRGLQHHGKVLVVSLDRIIPVLRKAAAQAPAAPGPQVRRG